MGKRKGYAIMSYYITLPSNGADLNSEYGKYNNTQTDFEIDLKKPLDFSYKDYEVGLSQFSCSLSWLIPIGTFKIVHKAKLHKDFEFDLNCSDGIYITNMIDIINRSIRTFELPTEHGKTESIQLSYDYKSKLLFIYVPIDYELIIQGYFLTLIEYIQDDIDDGLKKNFTILDSYCFSGQLTTCVLTMSQVNYIRELFIYTNIIENQHVGSEMVRLLKVINVQGLFGDTIVKNFDFPHYLA